MSAITSSLSTDQQTKLLSLFGHVRLHLLYKASIHGFDARAFHCRCDQQGPTVIVAYNAAGFVFGAYTSEDYTQCGEAITDEAAFLYSISAGGNKPLRVAGISGQCAFTDGCSGPDFGALVFLHNDEPLVESNPGNGFNFQAADMHGSSLELTELEVYRVEALEDLLAKPWRNIQWTAEYVENHGSLCNIMMLWVVSCRLSSRPDTYVFIYQPEDPRVPIRRKQQLMTVIQNYQPEIKTVQKARVLLVGPVGAGKSSFFNSINSAFRGNMTSQAIAGTGNTSVTTQFRTYIVRAGKGGAPIPLVLCDTMGLEDNADSGLNAEDLISILKGHINDRYQFSTSAPLSEGAPGYKRNVTLNEMIHCVVYVVDTCKVSLLSQKILDKFAAVRKKANQMGIPQILLMTKIDEACPLVAEDLKNVYRSVYIQQKARQMSESLGIPLSHVIPVKNYSEELDLDQNTDILLFTAVQQMLNFADSFYENHIPDDQSRNGQLELYRADAHSCSQHNEPQIV